VTYGQPCCTSMGDRAASFLSLLTRQFVVAAVVIAVGIGLSELPTLGAVTSATLSSSQAPQGVVVWCSTVQVSDLESAPPNVQWLDNYQHAHRALCAGDAATARAGFAAMLTYMNKYEVTDGSAYIDYARSYFYALLAAHDDQGARSFLTSWEGANWKAGQGERLFWNEDYAGSFAAFVAEDGNVYRTPDQQHEHKLDPHLNYALADVRLGKLDDAAREMQADADRGDLYLLMLGDIYAQERHWPQAFTTWVAAADVPPGFAEPGWVSIQHWNLSALEMMYYYRAHAPAHAAAPQFSCGSPTDLATVESLALKLPETTGLNATRIMDAAASGPYARVDVETKGVYAAYFQYRDGAWTTATLSDVKTELPNPELCRNPQFVNQPSGP
jgi:hypothetical protein